LSSPANSLDAKHGILGYGPGEKLGRSLAQGLVG